MRYYNKEDWVQKLSEMGFREEDFSYWGHGSIEVFDEGEVIAEWTGFFDLDVSENSEFGIILEKKS